MPPKRKPTDTAAADGASQPKAKRGPGRPRKRPMVTSPNTRSGGKVQLAVAGERIPFLQR